MPDGAGIDGEWGAIGGNGSGVCVSACMCTTFTKPLWLCSSVRSVPKKYASAVSANLIVVFGVLVRQEVVVARRTQWRMSFEEWGDRRNHREHLVLSCCSVVLFANERKDLSQEVDGRSRHCSLLHRQRQPNAA